MAEGVRRYPQDSELEQQPQKLVLSVGPDHPLLLYYELVEPKPTRRVERQRGDRDRGHIDLGDSRLVVGGGGVRGLVNGVQGPLKVVDASPPGQLGMIVRTRAARVLISSRSRPHLSTYDGRVTHLPLENLELPRNLLHSPSLTEFR